MRRLARAILAAGRKASSAVVTTFNWVTTQGDNMTTTQGDNLTFKGTV